MSIKFVEGTFPRGSISSPTKEEFGFDNIMEEAKTQDFSKLYNQQSYFSRPADTMSLSHVEPIFQGSVNGFQQNTFSTDNLRCIDVAHHIRDCPVCSRLHKSQAPFFIGIILLLSIIILFLGKRFFE